MVNFHYYNPNSYIDLARTVWGQSAIGHLKDIKTHLLNENLLSIKAEILSKLMQCMEKMGQELDWENGESDYIWLNGIISDCEDESNFNWYDLEYAFEDFSVMARTKKQKDILEDSLWDILLLCYIKFWGYQDYDPPETEILEYNYHYFSDFENISSNQSYEHSPIDFNAVD